MSNTKWNFEDYSVQVMQALDKKAITFLEEAKLSLSSQAARNTKRVTGQLADSFTTDSVVDKDALTAYIGSSVEYAPYYELGTGEYALNGDGRKGGWAYRDKKTGKIVFTRGSSPRRPLYNAFIQKEARIIKRCKEIYGK